MRRRRSIARIGRGPRRRAIGHLLGRINLAISKRLHPSLGGKSLDRDGFAIQSARRGLVSIMDPQGVDVVDGVVDGGSNIIENIISRRRWAVMIPIPRRRRPAEAAFHRSCVPLGPRQCRRFFCARRRRLADRRRLASGITPITGGSAQRVPVGAVVVVVPGRRAAPTAREAPSGVRQADEGPAAALGRGGGLLLHDLKSA